MVSLVVKLVLMRIGSVYIAMFLKLVMLFFYSRGAAAEMCSSSINSAHHICSVYILDLTIVLAALTLSSNVDFAFIICGAL